MLCLSTHSCSGSISCLYSHQWLGWTRRNYVLAWVIREKQERCKNPTFHATLCPTEILSAKSVQEAHRVLTGFPDNNTRYAVFSISLFNLPSRRFKMITKTRLDCLLKYEYTFNKSTTFTWKKEIGEVSLKDYFRKQLREIWISKIHQGKCIAEIIYFMPI